MSLMMTNRAEGGGHPCARRCGDVDCSAYRNSGQPQALILAAPDIVLIVEERDSFANEVSAFNIY